MKISCTNTIGKTILFFFLFMPCIADMIAQEYSGFLKVKGKSIVDENDQEVLLKGINLGNWLVNEPYMMHMPGNLMGIEREMRREVLDVLGGDTVKMNNFYKLFHDNYVQPIDIKAIHEWGFNSIRLPLDADKLGQYDSISKIYTINEAGYARIDSVIKWARPYNLYVILDMHRVPGGSGAAVIMFNNDLNHPDAIFNNPVLQDHYVAAWEALAKRYADEYLVAGYDLMNEPDWNFNDNNLNKPLLNLYKRATTAIRCHDDKHILFIEGNGYSWDFRGLKLPWDANMVYAFHKYLNWQVGDYDVNEMVKLRDGTNRPVWNGETGENSNLWLTNMARRYEAANIGWCVWPQKKIGSIVGPLTITKSDKYQKLILYWQYKEDNSRPYYAKPSVDEAYTALMEQADLCRFEACAFHKDYIDALVRQPATDEVIPWKNISLPEIVGRTLRVNASEFDLGVVGSAYQTSQRDWNTSYQFRNDEINVLKESGEANGYVVGNIHSDNTLGKEEWTQYTLTAPVSGSYEVRLRYRADNLTTSPAVGVEVNGVKVSNSPYTLANNNRYATELIGKVDVNQGDAKVKVYYHGQDFKVSTIDFKLTEISTGIETVNGEKQEDLRIIPLTNGNGISFRNAAEGMADIQIYDSKGICIAKSQSEEVNESEVSFLCSEGGLYVVRINYHSGKSQTARYIHCIIKN